MASMAFIGLGLIGSTGGGAPPQSEVGGALVEAQSSTFEVGARGARVTETRALVPAHGLELAPNPGIALVQQLPSGLVWTRSDPQYWVGKIVSLGDHGTQVFTEFDSGIDHAEFLSGFDQSPATPVWQTPSGLDLAQASCDSAETSDVHVTLHQVVTAGDQQHRQPVLALYTSSSPLPDWTYAFPAQIGGTSRVAISRNGQRIVAAILNNFTSKIEVAVFAPTSSTPLSYTQIPFCTQMRGFDLSADGSTLYLSTASQAYLFDVATHSIVHQIGLPTALDCHALSGNGSVFAYGTFGTLEVFERNVGGGYAHTHTRTVPGQCVCARIDISDDGSTIAYGFNYFDTNLRVHVEALDVPTKAVTMQDDAIGTGTLQNVMADVSIDEDGGRFAVGLWGDEGNVCPELRFYSKYQNAPVATFNLPGSVFDVDISADGDRVAVASKLVHANTFASGGQISLYAFAREDLRARGVPVLGGRVSFTIAGNPGQPAQLLWSDAPAQTPFEFPNIGTLYLRRTSLNAVPMTPVGADGRAMIEFPLPTTPGTIGQTLYFQGFLSNPRHLTNDWIALTVLP